MDLKISGRCAAVAAASRGLGFGTARALAAEGVRVAICGRDREKVEKAAASLGPDAVPLVVDVSNAEGAREFVVKAREALGGLDILVTNAGGPPPGNFEQTPLEAYPKAISLNLMSVVAMCIEAVPGMREQKWGRIVAITSLAVRQPIASLILSNTARAGATGFLKTLASEVAKDGITVNSLQPGMHKTERVSGLLGGNFDALAATIPTRTIGEADDFGRAAAFLCSEHARFITGTAIPVDGGANTALL